MIELLVVACLGTAGCRDISLLYDGREVSLMTCMIAAEGQIAAWQQQNPGYTIVRWSCGYNDPRRGGRVT